MSVPVPRDDSFHALLERLSLLHQSLEKRYFDSTSENFELRTRLSDEQAHCRSVKMQCLPLTFQPQPVFGAPLRVSGAILDQMPSPKLLRNSTTQGSELGPEVVSVDSTDSAAELPPRVTVGSLNSSCPDKSYNSVLEAWAHLVVSTVDKSRNTMSWSAPEWATFRPELEPVWSLRAEFADLRSFPMYFDKTNERRILQMKHESCISFRVGDHLQDKTWFGRISMTPNGAQRMTWSICSCVLILYDTITIPLLVFDIRETLTYWVVFHCALVFWILDVFLNFITGYNMHGQVEMRMTNIARRYLSSWFFPDMSIIAVDIVLLILESDDGSAGFFRLGRFSRFFRLIRAVRLLRIIKMADVFSDLLDDLLHSESSVLLMMLTRHVITLFVVNHYIACAWYGISLSYGEQDVDATTWVNAQSLALEPIPYKYVMSLHWSLTQFSPATNNISPTNYTERCFAVTIVLFALIAFSSFLSSITGLVTQLKSLSNGVRRDEARLRDFLSTRRVRLNLRNRMWRFFRTYNRQARRFSVESGIGFLKVMPESMLIELHREVYFKTLLSSAVFGAMLHVEAVLFEKVCHIAMSESVWVPNQDVFVSGKAASRAFAVTSGTLVYTTVCDDFVAHHVTIGDWVSEVMIWVRWIHCGQLQATSSCSVVEVLSAEFQTLIVTWGGPLCSSLKRFAALFLGHLDMLLSDCVPITDMSVGTEVLDGLAKRAMAIDRLKFVEELAISSECHK